MSNATTQETLSFTPDNNDSEYRSNDEIFAASHKDAGVESYIDEGEDAIEAEMPEVEGYTGDPSFEEAEDDFEEHFRAMLANRARYIDFYMPAYQFGFAYGICDKYESDFINDALEGMQEMWEDVNPNTWDTFVEAIRRGWNIAYSLTHDVTLNDPIVNA
ncbi:MAG: hypothetical protein AAFR81_28940 [Chloroflexota bacterium]